MSKRRNASASISNRQIGHVTAAEFVGSEISEPKNEAVRDREPTWSAEDQAEADARIVAAYRRGEDAQKRLLDNGFKVDAQAVRDLLDMIRAAEEALDDIDDEEVQCA